MSSQFINGHPPSGPRHDNPMVSHPGYSYPGQMVSGGAPSSFIPQGSNIQAGHYATGSMMAKPPYNGPPGPSNQSDAGAWNPSHAKDANGVPSGHYNPNQMSSEFGSMQIGGRPGPQWSQNPNQVSNHPGQLSDYAQGHRVATAPQSLDGNAFPHQQTNPNAFQFQPPNSNAFPPQQPPNSNAFQTQPPSSSLYPPQSRSNAFMQPPASFANRPSPTPNLAPQGFPPLEPPMIGNLPTRSMTRPPLSGDAMAGGHMPTYMNSGPPQFPSGPIPFHGPPGGQWGSSSQPPQQNAPIGYADGMQHGAFNNPPSQPINPQPYPPHAQMPGIPVNQGQKPKFPSALPDGSYSGAPGFQQGPPYLSQGAFPSQPAETKRLDPDHMPSQVQMLEYDQTLKGGLYQTGQRGSVPPLSTTNFIVEDLGTCSPRFFRASMYSIPCSGDLLRQSNLPLTVALTPFAKLAPEERPPPIVDLGQMGPVRCNRCKVYMCPGMIFVDGGRKFQCCFCNGLTEVPPEYFAHLDTTGVRIDYFDRPELHLGAYEFVAPVEYCQGEKLPQPPAFIFMIDVSYSSVKSGLVNLLCSRLKQEILANLPKDVDDNESEVRVGFVTYAKELHFYNIKGNLTQPQMLVVSDIHDVFIPLVDGFLVKPSEAASIIDSLLIQISQMFCEAQERESILGPVIQAGLDALKSSERVGKLLIFHSSFPSLDAPGKLKMREDKSLLGTDKEKNLLTPQNKFYTKLGKDCLAAGCSVDIFLFPTSYMDVATIAEVPHITGGSLYKYNNFQADLDGDMLLNDLRTNVERQLAFNVTLKLRTSTGIRPVDFFGNFFMENTTEVEMASLDKDKCVTIEIKHDDKLSEAEGAIAQAVVLYTSVGGKRRLRVLNTTFDCCTKISDLYKQCELDALINYLAKLSIRESLNSNVKQVREHLTNRCVQILACYRKNCTSPSNQYQLILPECLKLLPAYINSMLKSSIFQSENINVDDRSYYINLVNSMNISDTVAYFYPRILPLHELDLKSDSLPSPIRCTYEKLKDNGAYLLENGQLMFLWVGLQISIEWLQQVFGVTSVGQVNIDKTKLHDFDNPLSRRVKGIVENVRIQRHRHMKLIILRKGDTLEHVMQNYLVEDKMPLISYSLSYVDFLCHIHKEIRNLLI